MENAKRLRSMPHINFEYIHWLDIVLNNGQGSICNHADEMAQVTYRSQKTALHKTAYWLNKNVLLAVQHRRNFFSQIQGSKNVFVKALVDKDMHSHTNMSQVKENLIQNTFHWTDKYLSTRIFITQKTNSRRNVKQVSIMGTKNTPCRGPC